MLLRILPWAIWAVLVVFSVGSYAGLPADIPQHLNAAGEVTRSVDRNWLSWLALPLVAGAIQAMLSWLSLRLRTQPELFNFPEKDRFLRLPGEYQGEVIRLMQETLGIIAAFTMLVMLGVQVMLWRAALGHASESSFPLLMITTIAFMPLAYWLTSRVNASAQAAEKKWSAATGGTDSRTSGPR